MFERFAEITVKATGKAWAFIASVLLVVVWGITGPLFDFNDTWQLVINTATTIITFWMVFVIQHSQNKDTIAVKLKLDNLLKAVQGTDESLIGVEKSSEKEMEKRDNMVTEADNG